MHKRLSRALALILATPLLTAGLAGTAAVPAHAAAGDAYNWCAFEPVIDGSTRIRACGQIAQGDNAYAKPWAKMRFASSDPTKWQACAIVVALFIDGQKRTDKTMNCLAFARAGTAADPEVVTFSGWTTTHTGSHSYEGVARWYGYYDNQPVGSHVNSHSGPNQISSVGSPGGLGVSTPPVDNDVDAPPAVKEYMYEPAVPVEFATAQ